MLGDVGPIAVLNPLQVPLRNDLDAASQASPSALSIESIEGVNFAQLVDKPATQVDQSLMGPTQSIDEAAVQEQGFKPVRKARRAKNPARRALDFSRTVWKAYNRTLESQPILVKSATSFFGFMVGFRPHFVDESSKYTIAKGGHHWPTDRGPAGTDNRGQSV